MLVCSIVFQWVWMLLVLQLVLWLLCLSPQVTLHINVSLKDMDYQSNQKAFSQDFLLRGYAHGWKKDQAQTLAALSASLRFARNVTAVKTSRGSFVGHLAALFFKCPLFLIDVLHPPSRQGLL